MDIAKLIRQIPKAELHLHIEGTLEPELMMQLAGRNGLRIPYDNVEEIWRAYEFSDLQSFLDIYYAGAAVLQSEQDFYDLTYAYLECAAADNVRHVEIFFDPQTHTERSIAFTTVLDGIHGALEAGETELRITSRLIMCFRRHLSAEDAMATLESTLPHLARLHVVGLDSSEVGHPPSKFTGVFDTLEEHNLAKLLDAGLCVTVNSDDPAYFGGYIGENFLQVQHALGLDADRLQILARNAFTASFLPPDDIERHIRAVDAIFDSA